MDISSSLFESFLNCPTKCFLFSKGKSQTDNPYFQWAQSTSEEYISRQIARIRSSCVSDKILSEPDIKDFLKTGWQFSFNFLATTSQFKTVIQAIERIQPSRKGIQSQLIPIRFCFKNKLSKNDKLILGFEAFVLAELTGHAIEYGKLIHGDNANVLKVKVSALFGAVRKVTRQINVLLSSTDAPDLNLIRHCDECEFKFYCKQKALEKNDLSLLSSMSTKERKKYNSKGIFTVTQLSYTFRPRRRSKRQRDKLEKYHHSLKALSIREQKIHIVGNLELKLDGTPVYVDVEGIPDRDFYYLIGVRIDQDGSVSQYNLWANTQVDEQRIWTDFLEILNKLENPIIIHYGGYESSFFRKMSTRYNEPEKDSSSGKAIVSAVNLLSIIYAQIYFPTYGNGLKEIASYLGYKWSEIDASGLLSITWYHEWLTNKTGKDKLIQYNLQDCEALSLVAQYVLKLANDFSSNAPADKLIDNVIRTDSIKSMKNTKWRTFTSPVKDFEHINSTAHWNYQRDRVFVRSGTVRKNNVKPLFLRGRPRQVYRTIQYKTSRQCPKCQKKYCKKGRVALRVLQDLVFGRFSIKRRFVKYIFQTYICRNCQTVFGIPEMYTVFRKHGWNMIAYFFFQIIELGIPQRTVAKHFNRIFGYSIHRSSLNNIKAVMADYYSETKQAILDLIIHGHLIHADETRANIKGVSAFVWVLTSMQNVVYILAENREGELIQKQLTDFKGVLVSDFYAAYDSISCPQQKCLIHFMRDLNDDVLDNPFDEQLKNIAIKFSTLLKPMVETVDRYGLKTYFLKKHIVNADRFFAEIGSSQFSSEAALKYKVRLEKNRDKLFTFLSYDGIPWNNNNAEHAIKAFAALRDVIAGSSTAKGVDEYLTLLSICQTCKYRGLDFVDFIRSGKKNIEAFTALKHKNYRY